MWVFFRLVWVFLWLVWVLFRLVGAIPSNGGGGRINTCELYVVGKKLILTILLTIIYPNDW